MAHSFTFFRSSPKVTFSFGFHDHPIDNLTLTFLIPSTCLIFTTSTYHHPTHCIINLKKKIQSFVCSCWNICFIRAGFFHLGKCPKEDRYSLLLPVAVKWYNWRKATEVQRLGKAEMMSYLSSFSLSQRSWEQVSWPEPARETPTNQVHSHHTNLTPSSGLPLLYQNQRKPRSCRCLPRDLCQPWTPHFSHKKLSGGQYICNTLHSYLEHPLPSLRSQSSIHFLRKAVLDIPD